MMNVLITGASRGIGGALAEKMSNSGFKITGLARRFTEGSPVDDRIELDLADLSALENQLLNNPAFKREFDVIVLNAGVGRFGGLEQFSFQQIQQLINVNLLSNLFLLKQLLPMINAKGDKDIVLIGSEAALSGAKQGAVYCASKFALRGLAQSLRSDIASNGNRVMLVNPGPTDSQFFEALHFEPKAGDEYSLSVDVVADTIMAAIEQPRTAVLEEINIQPLKRAFEKK